MLAHLVFLCLSSFAKKSGTVSDGETSSSSGTNPPDQTGPTGPAAPLGSTEGSSSGLKGFEATAYTTSTRKAARHVDVTVECQGQTVVDYVDSKISEDLLLRRTANQMKLEGHWTAMVVNGGGKIVELQPRDHIVFNPASSEDIQKIIQPRTSASVGDPTVKSNRLAPGASCTGLAGDSKGTRTFR
jgi:hypothetical protein